MENSSADHEAEDSESAGRSSLDFIDDNYRTKSNLFQLSDVRLVDRLKTENDLENESGASNVHLTETKYFADLYDEGFITIKDEKRKRDDEAAPYEVEESLQIPPASAPRRFSPTTLFPSPSNSSSINDGMESDEISTSPDLEDVKMSARREQTLFAYSKEISLIKFTQSRREFVDKSVSILEKRLSMIGKLKELLEERKWIKMKNRYLIRKCCQVFEKFTAEGPFETPERATPIHEDKRYEEVLEDFMVVQTHYETTRPMLEDMAERLTNSYETLRKLFDHVFRNFIQRELEIGSDLIDDRSKKTLQKIRFLTKVQKMKMNELSSVRVFYFKLTNRLTLINMKLQRVNHLGGEGQSLIDYEQLVNARGSLMDKIDERDGELHKLWGKCSRCATILSHMKETSEALIYDVMRAASELKEVTKMKKRERASLVAAATKRDALRKDTLELRHVGCLLEKPTLLKKMQSDSRMLEILQQRVKKMIGNGRISVDVGGATSEIKIVS